MKKIFLLCLALLLGVQGVAAAKSGLSEEERIKVAVELEDTSRHKDLGTAQILQTCLSEELVKKNLLNVVETKITGEPFDEEGTADKETSAANLGELLVFDAVELPPPSDTPENFDQTFYRDCGASYVIRCEVLALGLTKVEDKTISTIFGAAGGLTSVVGAWKSGSAGKTLRRVGTGLGLGGFVVTERTALNTVVNMQFIDVETGKILWQEHFQGLAVKHHKGGKHYDDPWTRAHNESVEDTARRIAKRVNKYVDKVVIKGKSDKSFLPKNASVGGFVGGKIF